MRSTTGQGGFSEDEPLWRSPYVWLCLVFLIELHCWAPRCILITPQRTSGALFNLVDLEIVWRPEKRHSSGKYQANVCTDPILSQQLNNLDNDTDTPPRQA